jgi:hypothetical protein
MNRNGSGPAAFLGAKTTVWSLTPSRIGTMASVTANSGKGAGVWPVAPTQPMAASAAAKTGMIQKALFFDRRSGIADSFGLMIGQ